jgi:threonine 3-dehydrogenase
MAERLCLGSVSQTLESIWKGYEQIMKTMKAIVKSRREAGFHFKEVPIPSVKPGEVLVKIHATGICGSDLNFYRWNHWAEKVSGGVPFIPGHEFAGEVVEVGEGVEGFALGDHVAGETHIPCGHCYHCLTGNQHICQNVYVFGHGPQTSGSFAEYATVPAVIARRISKNISWEHGAILEPLTIATRAVIEADIVGESVIVMGCGPIGLLAVSVATAAGAAKIFAVDIQSYRLDIARRLSADFVLNPNDDKVVDVILAETGGYGAGRMIEMSGAPEAINAGFKALRKASTVVMVGMPKEPFAFDFMNNVVYKEATIKGIHGRRMYQSWMLSESLLEQRRIEVEPVITQRLPLEEYEKGFQLMLAGQACKVVFYPEQLGD